MNDVIFHVNAVSCVGRQHILMDQRKEGKIYRISVSHHSASSESDDDVRACKNSFFCFHSLFFNDAKLKS